MTNNKKVTQGFSLIEVLIALIVLSVGLLGLANLQGQSISSSYNAHLRTQATSLARNVIDRMRANRTLAAETESYQTDFETPPEDGLDCSSNNCDAADIAKYDLKEWKCNLGMYSDEPICAGLVSQVTLPNGEGQIESEDATGQTKVTVRWTDTAGAEHRVVMFTSI
ncbi:MAG: type IV pilus modification protein PilV [Gammaproteobacteria bacterium]